MNRDERIVVVGGGLTGLRAAERLRELKFEGDITILGDEKLPPYHRPALSKQLLQGTLRPSDLTLPAYEELNARWRFGTQVRQLIPSKKTLVLPGGEEMTYDGLIIATGVEATKQNGVPYHDPRVLVLRTMSDGLDLERVVGSTKGRIAVIGGGFTGCELAASLRHLSREVTLIGRGKNLLGNVLGNDLGEWLTSVHRDHGVDLALGNSVEEWNPTSEGIGLKLTDGSTLMVSCVILAAGTKPMTHWLRGSGLPLDNGVVCEPTCHVVGADDVVAAGDVAQWPNLRFDNVPRRVEHWLNAVEMGRAAAESLLAGRTAADPFTPMPRFWTEQYGVRIQAAGMPKLGKDIVKLGTPDEGTGNVYGYSLEGRLMAVVGVDCPGAMITWAESVSRQNPAPRPRVPEDAPQETKVPVSVGGVKKKGAGKHQLPVKGKQFQREDRQQPAAVSYVEDTPTPAEISGPIGVGTGRVPVGRPQNVVDSFSRMLPVAVRPENGMPGPGMPPPNGRGGPQNGRRPMAGAPTAFAGAPAGPPVRTTTSGPIAGPVTNGGPRGPISAPFGDGVSHSGVFRNVPGGNGRVLGSPFSANGRPANGAPRNGSPANGAPANGTPISSVPTSPFAAQPNGQRLISPATNRIPAQDSGPMERPGHLPVPIPPATPEFSAAELTDIRNGFPPPLAGRMSPDGLAIDVTGQMALLDANGHLRKPDFSDPLEDAYNLPARRGTSDSFSKMPAVSRAAANGGRMRGPEESFGGLPALPPARGSESSFSAMPPASRGTGGGGGRRRAEDSAGGLPPARRGSDSARMPAMRGPEESHRSMPPARRGAEESHRSMPPARRGGEDSHRSMPPARRGGEDSFSAMPPARRGGEESLGSMPPARRGSGDSFSSMPPARRGGDDSFSSMPPARRGGEDSFSAMPPARRSAEESFSSMPPARRSAPATNGRAPSSGGGRRRAEDSASRMPAARESYSRPAARREDSYDRLPAARREDSYDRLPAARREDSYDQLSVTSTSVRADSYDRLPTASSSIRSDSYDRLPAVSDSRRAAHRAEDLTPEFGRPQKRRGVDPDQGSARRLLPAMSSVEESMPPARMPKHGRPEDYGHLPSSRSGPEDSYDQLPAVERRAASGGRRRRA